MSDPDLRGVVVRNSRGVRGGRYTGVSELSRKEDWRRWVRDQDDRGVRSTTVRGVSPGEIRSEFGVVVGGSVGRMKSQCHKQNSC